MQANGHYGRGDLVAISAHCDPTTGGRRGPRKVFGQVTQTSPDGEYVTVEFAGDEGWLRGATFLASELQLVWRADKLNV